MTEERRHERDVAVLRTAVICVGLSGVLLGAFVLAAQGEAQVGAAACMAAGVVMGMLGVTRWPVVTMIRSSRIVAYWVLVAVLVLELMIPLNYAGARRRTAFDWTDLKLRELSEKTVKVIGRVQKPLYVTTFFVQADPDERRIFDAVKDLLDEYVAVNPYLIVEHVDPAREPDKMVRLKQELALDPDQPRYLPVVFRYGENRKDVWLTSLLPRFREGVDPMANPDEVSPDQIVFFGEQEFTSAILQVTADRQRGLTFVTNHGEQSPSGELFWWASQFRRDNYRVSTFDALADGVPQDCTVLVIIGPKTEFSDREIASLDRYLGSGGRLFVALDPGVKTGIEPMLGKFGIYVGNNIVVDRSSGTITPIIPVRVAPQAGTHPVTERLRQMVLTFPVARSVEAIPPKPGILGRNWIQAATLLTTSNDSWGETDFDAFGRGVTVFDPQNDKPGPLGVAAVHEQPEADFQGKAYPAGTPRTRVIAVGTGNLVVSRFRDRTSAAAPPNRLFFYAAVSWLAEVEELIAIPPRPFGVRPLDRITPAHRTAMFWILTAAMPALFLAAGGLMWFVRRRT